MLDFQSIISSNPFFTGGFGLAVVAAGAQIFRSGTSVAIKLMKKNFLVTLEVTIKDKSYPWILKWLYSRSANSQHLSVETSLIANSTNSSKVKFNFVPGPGQHLLFFNGKYMLVQRFREQQMVDFNSGKPWEKIEFTSLGRNTAVFSKFLEEASLLASK
jgi:chaperone BCS1